MDVKDTNPKDAVGIAKVPLSVIPAPVLSELALALLEGARKYGRHNWRAAKARASVYYDAAGRHLMAWYEGEDIDKDSDLNHITKAIASLTVLRDAMIQDKWVDDRPPPSTPGWLAEHNKRAAVILKKYPDCVEPWTATRVVRETADALEDKIATNRFCQNCGNLLDDYEIETCKLHTCCKVGCNAAVHTSDPLCPEHEQEVDAIQLSKVGTTLPTIMPQCKEIGCTIVAISSEGYCGEHRTDVCGQEGCYLILSTKGEMFCYKHGPNTGTKICAKPDCPTHIIGDSKYCLMHPKSGI